MLCLGDAHDGAVGNPLNVQLLLFLLPALEPKMVLLVSVLEHSDVVPCRATVESMGLALPGDHPRSLVMVSLMAESLLVEAGSSGVCPLAGPPSSPSTLSECLTSGTRDGLPLLPGEASEGCAASGYKGDYDLAKKSQKVANLNADEKVIPFHSDATCPDHFVAAVPPGSPKDIHYSDGGSGNAEGSKQIGIRDPSPQGTILFYSEMARAIRSLRQESSIWTSPILSKNTHVLLRF
ncbi:hypothetical protein Nepgr_022866 [Nepenthes gracilis]|uniref:Uncharacterized protein n=1 Tax=Nepenthes gracilis TaxID=150966 RepID=A0AAD3T1L0_NEPGR|nr:hypothetical protein Nepgr_022866 [Nepenthes gracilis]